MKYLIVVDMQNDFITGSLGTPQAQAILANVIDKVRHYDGHVLYTRDTHTADYLNTQEGRNLPVIHCIEGEEGWQLADGLKELADPSSVYDKPTFGSTDLISALQNIPSGETAEFELCGLCTDICVISNAMLLKAFFPESPVTVDASCCAGVTPASHKNALEAMRMCQIIIKNEEKEV